LTPPNTDTEYYLDPPPQGIHRCSQKSLTCQTLHA